MALQTINIDDRNFDQLLAELKQQIPVSLWTDHHPSDPGIMLLELFAWLGEITLYRMNQVPETHREKFLKLLIDPPEPVTVDVELEYMLIESRKDDLVVPSGIRFATDFKRGERYIFETIKEAIIPAPTGSSKPTGTITVNTRTWKQIINEKIGISDGSPNQTFALKNTPVLLDFVYASTQYLPNPEVKVDGVKWSLKQFLLTKDLTFSDTKYFMVDGFENLVRFGDGTFGDIPPKNASVTCTYQVLQGPEVLIKAGELKYILDDIPKLDTGESINISGNKDAQGGMFFLKREEQLAKGLENFKKPYRLITPEDFEYALLTDFNELQQLTRKNNFNQLPENVKNYDIITLGNSVDEALFETIANDYFLTLPPSLYKILRVSVLMNRKLKKTTQVLERTGHVIIVVIPEFNPNVLDTQTYIDVSKDLEEKILKFLDNRKLITTHLHIMPVALKKIDIKLSVVFSKERYLTEMKETIRKQVNKFMGILQGGFDQKGWPTGKNLYKSHLYRLIEGIDGVDYVKSLILSPTTNENYIEIGENELPLLRNLDMFLERN